MATSILFRINNFILLEYIYASGLSPLTYSTSQVSFRKIKNLYTGVDTIVNNNNSLPLTNNTIDRTVVLLDNGKQALLDNDSAYFYPSLDPNIQVSNIVVSPALNVKYDVCRLHILSGYNFDDIEGFIFSLELRLQNNKVLKLTDFSYTKTDNRALYFSPRPKYISEFIYDKYIEIKVPSTDYMLDQQDLNPLSQTILPFYLTEGVYLAKQNTIYVDYKAIKTTEQVNGITYYTTDDNKRFAISSKDVFQSLIAKIQENTDNNYFEYYAEWDSEIIENFLYTLNSLAGNDYIVIHDLIVSEQVGQTFSETFSFTDIQTDKYNQIRKFRPILERSDVATSFSIDYTVKLYNRADGKSIFKTSSISSLEINNYGNKIAKLNVDNLSQPIKVYNKISENSKITLGTSDQNIVRTKYSTVFIDKSEITIATDDQNLNNGVTSGAVTMKLDPFDNIQKFTLMKKPASGGVSPLDLTGLSGYNITYVKNDGSLLRIPEYLEIAEASKANGELYFKINSQKAREIQNYTNKIFYVTAFDSDNTEIAIFNGKFTNTINS